MKVRLRTSYFYHPWQQIMEDCHMIKSRELIEFTEISRDEIGDFQFCFFNQGNLGNLNEIEDESIEERGLGDIHEAIGTVRPWV